ncbi:hypothetical protein [Enterococcus sp.]|uniref:hypothetical protein n=1 Tax=Enterococcus sp. TaxID=35783 RepID=UPI0025BD97FB|nr:hypothetical protein [Enterococcus sp.]
MAARKGCFLALVATRKYFTIEMTRTYKKTRKNHWQRDKNFISLSRKYLSGVYFCAIFGIMEKNEATDDCLVANGRSKNNRYLKEERKDGKSLLYRESGNGT